MTCSYLIIDDDQHFGEVLIRSLSRQGNEAVHITGEEQLPMVTTAPDRIVLDLRLTEASGLDLIPRLKERWPDATIVMLTGYASIPTAVEAIKRGADNYLHKPATLAELQRAFEGGDATEESTEVMSVDRMEWEHIQRVLTEHDGNISATARALNMHRRTLQRKLQKYAPR